ncbi:DUF1217 domain-containing protein [Azospirillum sp. TSO22-1]|uniref:DUF1217 domain-containing protein n=1 Tax=Azospirillum sp. TSO22-1 TaxID=716789 RepID=UPI000D62252F|nr:DUF1217 domain-containing protein [Azospirillum sp. TSO22-1]PWC35166.1 flagellar biosynthesis protein FlgG [Azospirillum sp. TSO22-1]
MTTLQDFRQVARNQDRYDQMLRKRPDIQRNIAYFEANIGKVTSTEDFLKDDKLYRFVMEAFDLGSQVFARGLIRKVLNEGVDDPDAAANRMVDPKFRQLAAVLRFKEADGLPLKLPSVVKGIVDRYVQVNLEESSEETNPALRLALYFKRKAPSITNWYQVLGDRALQKVVFTLLDIPDQSAAHDIDKLKAAIERRLDINDLKSPGKVDALLERFASMYDMRNGAPASAAARLPVIGPLQKRASILSIDPAITATLVKLPRF